MSANLSEKFRVRHHAGQGKLGLGLKCLYLVDLKAASAESAGAETFTILTTEPNALCAQTHNRMPLMLAPEDFAAWLGKPDEWAALLMGSGVRILLRHQWLAYFNLKSKNYAEEEQSVPHLVPHISESQATTGSGLCQCADPERTTGSRCAQKRKGAIME
jgi:SOS response associated peptidase (SRAP)